MVDTRLKYYAMQLADKHLRELPDHVIVRESPSHYGTELSDDHRLFMWNGLVDHYLELNALELVDRYNRHIRGSEPILKAITVDNLDAELQQVIDSIVQALWNSQELEVAEDGNSGTLLAVNPTIGRVKVGNGNGDSNEGGVT